MEILTIYAVSAGSFLISLAMIRALIYFRPWSNTFIAKHFTYPYALDRHSFLGPWTRASIVVHLSYATLNLLVVFLKASSQTTAGNRAGTLSLINAVFLMASFYMSNLADILGITVKNCRRIHRAVGWMVLILASFHVATMLISQGGQSLEHTGHGLFAIIGAGCLGALALLSFPIFRRISYEWFLRIHQALAAIGVYGIWRHLPSNNLLPRLYIYVAVGVLLCTSLSSLPLTLFRNGFFSGNGRPRARITCQETEIETEKKDETETKKKKHAKRLSPFKVTIYLPRPITVAAGQYINLWLPSVSMWSWTQTHPFMITSWSRGKYGVLELWVEPLKGLTGTIACRAKSMGADGFSCLALYSGPHGVTTPVDNYESVILVASGIGLTAIIPYVKMLIHGYKTCTSYIRRIIVVWQVESLRDAKSMEELLNNLLKDDELDDGYILTISVYVKNEPLKKEKAPLSRHKRAFLYEGTPDYLRILQEEVSGENIQRLSGIRDDPGQALLIASTEANLRDELRHIVHGYLNQGMKMIELEYQP